MFWKKKIKKHDSRGKEITDLISLVSGQKICVYMNLCQRFLIRRKRIESRLID